MHHDQEPSAHLCPVTASVYLATYSTGERRRACVYTQSAYLPTHFCTTYSPDHVTVSRTLQWVGFTNRSSE